MTQQITLYIDTSTGNLLESLNQSQTVSPSTLPLAVGDTPLFQIYLMAPLPSYKPSQPNYYNIGTAGNTLELYLTNGLDENALGYLAYTWQVDWFTDPTNAYFYANVALNTEALITLISTNLTATAYLTIGYNNAGGSFTPFNSQVTLKPGLPNAVGPVPAGLTPLSLEQARGLFVPISGASHARRAEWRRVLFDLAKWTSPVDSSGGSGGW